jgi:hypothetical protein
MFKDTDICFEGLSDVFIGEQISWGNAEATLNAIFVNGATSRSIWYAAGALSQLGLAGVIMFLMCSNVMFIEFSGEM